VWDAGVGACQLGGGMFPAAGALPPDGEMPEVAAEPLLPFVAASVAAPDDAAGDDAADDDAGDDAVPVPAVPGRRSRLGPRAAAGRPRRRRGVAGSAGRRRPLAAHRRCRAEREHRHHEVHLPRRLLLGPVRDGEALRQLLRRLLGLPRALLDVLREGRRV
jgi:hypothetical protein